ncbi:SPO22-domain-containing protein [Cutaneotrichosporon oleaginosum]|uniref:SPO22-domain-containing protein n=1 Tax=Cutaneotrichosporon oleaginosum TaxID=879819 RepID=A0A0J0XSU9_9TREE|nr:SPO22-domain-containing protein [Cutaneotrichosporon oleaginosum]KLT44125.1 SPO22-domain-containing protein [Cutaneotrichosporon oleaginosum]
MTIAKSLCATAAELEQKVVDFPLPPGFFDVQERRDALLAYYLSRCDVALAEDNETLGFNMLEKAADLVMEEDMASELVQRVAYKCWECGNTLREAGAADASHWLYKGLNLVTKTETSCETPGLLHLQTNVAEMAAVGLGLIQRTEAIASQTVSRRQNFNVYLTSQIIWSLGETLYKKGVFKQAAQWFVLGAHPALMPGGIENSGKCRRKAALAYINGGDTERAKEQLQHCPAAEASTHYLSFLAAINSGREVVATAAIEQILNCPDLVCKHLLLMGQAAQEKGMRTALALALDALLSIMIRGGDEGVTSLHALTLTRCLMEMTLTQIRNSNNLERNSLLGAFFRDLEIGHSVIDELCREGKAAEHIKDIAWVYKTAFNAGVEGALNWDPSLVADIFDITAQIMDLVQMTAKMDTDPNLSVQRATAMFACFSGKMEVYRGMGECEQKLDLLRDLVNYGTLVRPVIAAAATNNDSEARTERMQSALSVLEAELLCDQGNWEGLEETVQHATKGDGGGEGCFSSLEALVTVLAKYPRCPTSFSIKILECLLETLSQHDTDGTQLAHWMHHVIAGLLHYDRTEEDEQAYRLLERFIEMMSRNMGLAVPQDECGWFASVAYNKGMSKYNSGDKEAACRWCDLALEIASRIDGAGSIYNDVSEYLEILPTNSDAPPPLQGNAAA